jgi:hypothetical protein
MVCSERVSAPLAVVDLHLATPAASAGGTYLASPLTERRPKIFPAPGLGVSGRTDRAAPISDPYAAGARSGRRHQSEVAEQLGLIEVEMFRGQLVAANLVTRHPAEVDVPSRGSDIARRRPHDTGVRTNEPALGGDERSFGEKARRLKTPVRERVPQHTEEAQNLSAAAHRCVRCDALGVVAPRIGVRVPRGAGRRGASAVP